MIDDSKLPLLARAAGTRAPLATNGEAPPLRSIVVSAASAYGVRPSDEATVPTGFDPIAVMLFESIVEAAFLVATADARFDESEQRTFSRLVAASCDGVVKPHQVAGLLSDVSDQFKLDGRDRRIQALAKHIRKPDHGREVLRIASLLAWASGNVGVAERAVLDALGAAMKLEPSDVETAIADSKLALTANV